jgi:ATP-binding cassette subfamily B protein
MRHHARPPADAPANQSTRNDWGTLKTLLPYLWAYKWRVIFALLCLVLAKIANVAVPLVLKELIDGLIITPDKPASLLILPAGLLIVYGLLRLSTTVFTELREFFFAKKTRKRHTCGYTDTESTGKSLLSTQCMGSSWSAEKSSDPHELSHLYRAGPL